MLLLQITSEPTMGNEILSTITASTLAVSVIQWLKNTKLIPFVNEHSTGLNRFLGWVMAFIAGTGIHYTFNGETGVLQITGLTAGVIMHSVTVTCKQYAVQWLVYRGVLKKDVTNPPENPVPVTLDHPVAPAQAPSPVPAGH